MREVAAENGVDRRWDRPVRRRDIQIDRRKGTGLFREPSFSS